MRLIRVHVNAALTAGAQVRLEAAAAAHVTRVLRLGVGDAVTLFVRGDANADATFNIGDAITILSFLFSMGPASCLVALDCNDDESVDIGDAIYTLSNLFSGGPQPPAPHPGCGADPTPGMLGCGVFLPCP